MPRKSKLKSTVQTSSRRRRATPAAAVWALVAGVSLAGVVSAAMSDAGRERLAASLGFQDQAMNVVALAPIDQITLPGAPDVVGSINSAETNVPMPIEVPQDLAEWGLELSKLRTENRMLTIERDRLRSELSALRSQGQQAAGQQAVGQTGALPDVQVLDVSRNGQPASRAQPNRIIGFDGGLTPQQSQGVRVNVRPLQQGELSPDPNAGLANEEQILQAMERGLAFEQASGVADDIAVSSTEFGILIANAASLTEAQQRWRDFSQTHQSMVNGLAPAVNVGERSDGTLVFNVMAGPLRNAADAVGRCAQLVSMGVLCQAVPYNGQALAMR